MTDCNHDCKNCAQKCEKADFIVKQNELSDIKKVIAVVSGKGGVGKSLVTALLTNLMVQHGKKCAVLDADITGASIPKMFGISGTLESSDQGLLPCLSSKGVRIVSANLLLPEENDPVLWRGPLIAGIVKQFWHDTIWGDIDYMFIDCPPGTGDVPLTIFQSIQIDGIVVVTSPQDLVSMIVGKAVKMARKMNIPILGVVENMSYLRCPDCGKEISLFGEGKVNEVASEFGLEVLGRVPIDPTFAQAGDSGKIEEIKTDSLKLAEDILIHLMSE